MMINKNKEEEEERKKPSDSHISFIISRFFSRDTGGSSENRATIGRIFSFVLILTENSMCPTNRGLHSTELF